jgi:hypothetical protein
MQFRLRTLLILLAVLPPILAGGWWGWRRYQDYRRQQQFEELIELITTSIDTKRWESIQVPRQVPRAYTPDGEQLWFLPPEPEHPETGKAE